MKVIIALMVSTLIASISMAKDSTYSFDQWTCAYESHFSTYDQLVTSKYQKMKQLRKSTSIDESGLRAELSADILSIAGDIELLKQKRSFALREERDGTLSEDDLFAFLDKNSKCN